MLVRYAAEESGPMSGTGSKPGFQRSNGLVLNLVPWGSNYVSYFAWEKSDIVLGNSRNQLCNS